MLVIESRFLINRPALLDVRHPNISNIFVAWDKHRKVLIQ